MTFLSAANAALYLGAQPTFVDIEADTGNINNTLIQASITKNTKCIVPVHFGGHPVDLQRIKTIANENELLVIEVIVGLGGAVKVLYHLEPAHP